MLCQGELLPFQGGNNEVISHKLYQSLNEEEKKHLHIFNYIAKDQTKPIHNSKKKRSCHSKHFLTEELPLPVVNNGFCVLNRFSHVSSTDCS